jgi:hypothetical protein
MPGLVPLNDLPDELRGTTVPTDDLPDAPIAPANPGGSRGGPARVRGDAQRRDPITYDPETGAAIPTSTFNARFEGAGTVLGGLDAAQTAARNVPVEVARSTARLLGMPQVGDNIRGAFSAQPFSERGREVSDAVSRGTANVIEPWLQAGGNALDATGIPHAREGVGAFLGTVGDIANVVPAAAGLGLLGREAVAANRALGANKGIREAGSVAPVAKAAGFEVTPSTVAATRSTKPEGYAAAVEGRARNPEASLRNAQQLNRRLGDELNIKVDADGRLDPGAFEEARKPAFGVYDEAKGIPGGPSPEYSDAVRKIIESADVPTEAAPEVARMLQKYGEVTDSGRLVEDLKNLRRTAAKRREGDSANQVANEALADVQMAIADELENELGRRAAVAGDAGFQERLQQARLHLAQLYETERATTGGYVDAAQLAARQQKTGKLTGNLQLGAHMGENLPDVFQHPQNAVPAATGRTPEAWGARSFLFRTGERLGGGLISRRAMRKYNEGIPVGPNALDEFGISPVRDRGYPSPMGPNAGPQPGPVPPSAPPGLFADELAPRGGAGGMPSAGRPEPGTLPFNQLLADQMAGDLTLEGALPPAPAARAPQGRPLDQVDFARSAPPAAPGQALPPLTQDQLRLAPDMPLSLEDARPASLSALLDSPVGLNETGLGRSIVSSFADQLGPVAPRLDEALAEQRGMPTRPRGVTGPMSAQLTDPRLPNGLSLLDDTPPPQPLFGPGDEFPTPPNGGGVSDLIGDRLYRGVPEGMDPNAPNARGFTTWSNQRPIAEQYGNNVGEMQFDPGANIHLGTLEDARQLLGLSPQATAQDIAEAAMLRFRGANRTASYDLPPELSGTPREFIHFGQ